MNGEIVSADSMQVYRHMDIGTAKPTQQEMCGITHHMIDVVSPFDSYSVARYVEAAAQCVDGILSRGKLPIIVGGTGLYIESLLSGRTFAEEANEDLRAELGARYDRVGGEEMLDELRQIDPISAARLHANDKKRIIRAFEIYRLTGMTISEHDAMTKALPPRYQARTIALSFQERADLYERIDRRVDLMMEKGLLSEVRKLLDMGLTQQHTAMQAIGYKELTAAVLEGGNIGASVETIKRESRRYAKRQLSWFRRDQSIRWILWENEPDFDLGLQISTQYLE
jgi:tRNA dimethylallyltransferase